MSSGKPEIETSMLRQVIDGNLRQRILPGENMREALGGDDGEAEVERGLFLGRPHPENGLVHAPI
jgi:hypothetical protein